MRFASLPHPINRRRFLACAAGASLGTIQVNARAGSARKIDDSEPVVDTHVHCFAGEEDQRFPYHPRAPYRPEAPATPQHLLQCMDEIGISHAIIVHPEPYQDDHRYLEYCLEIGKNRLKGTCLFFADRPGSLANLPALVKRMPMVSIRVHAYAPDRLPPFGKPEMRDLWRNASENGLAVQIHLEPRYAPGFEPLIKEFRETPVIIDHLGRPFQGTPEEHERIIQWSRFKNTIMKISAIPSALSYPHRDPGTVIRRVVESFGPDRLIYGGGFAAEATAKSYRQALDRARSLINALPASDQGKILGANAVRLFGFKSAR